MAVTLYDQPARPIGALLTSGPSNTRKVALGMVNAIVRQRLTFDEVWTKAISLPNGMGLFDQRDKAFVRAMVTTCLRHLGEIDDVISRCLEHEPTPRTRDILRLGVAQLLFMKVAVHAAVGETVDLAETPTQKSLVNAILRRLDKDGESLLETQDSARLNLPLWLWESLKDAYGEATLRQITEAHLLEPPIDFTIRPGQDVEKWRQKLGGTILSNGSQRRIAGGRIEDLPGFAEGAWWVQDVAATLPVILFGDLSGKTVVDLCAAPGGKTLQIAAMGANVIAVDRSPRRLLRVEANLFRLGLSAQQLVANAMTWRPETPFEYVLLDAPCSATGTIRRHPETSWIKTPRDIAKLTAAQQALLSNATGIVAPGGTLIYSVCSLLPEEGEEQIDNFLEIDNNFERVPIKSEEVFGWDFMITAKGDVRTLPHYLRDIGGMDGFYIARLRRKS